MQRSHHDCVWSQREPIGEPPANQEITEPTYDLSDRQCNRKPSLPTEAAIPLAFASPGNDIEPVIPYAELEDFFSGLVIKAQAQGITCAITSGMACVHFGIAATTKDCDVLCDAASSDAFLKLIAGTELRGLSPGYRGNISPPLDARWMRGGWTSHIAWKTKPEVSCLDIFGIAPRGSSPWQNELRGIYARPHVVAEMKRTNREKDWPFATALGGYMLDEGDSEGWLHLYDVDVLRQCAKQTAPPKHLARLRPLLGLVPFTDTLRVKRVLLAERAFWSELDELRVKIYQKHLRPYTAAVRHASAGRKNPHITESHALRMECALAHLPHQPLRDYGLDRMISEASHNVGITVGPDVLAWLPAAENHFYGL